MLFSSVLFLWAFLPITVVLNYFIKEKYSNILLLLSSLLFYAWGEPVYILLMLASIAFNWGCGLWLENSAKHKKGILALCIVLNLAILGYFKYFNFFIDIINNVIGTQILSIRDISLPIGISFFTFQALSYVIDLYRGKCKVQRNVLHMALYISFFPQLIAGPIVRYADIEEQICTRMITREKFASGFRRFLYGLGKKIIISNTLAELADTVFAPSNAGLTTVAAWIGAVAYMMQIYYDFSGYSDMAIGLGRMFGFEFLENFKLPYLSRSIREFWQRWHISLGTWFKEYVYIPLGGNRKGEVRTYLNLFIVFFLTGLWHGASWSFVVWGLYHGIFQIFERLGLKHFLSKHKIISHFYCLFIVLIGWVVFRVDTLEDSIYYISRMLAVWQLDFGNVLAQVKAVGSIKQGVMLCFAVLGCGLVQNIAERFPKLLEKWRFSYIEAAYLCVLCIYCLTLLAAGTYNPFIYFRF